MLSCDELLNISSAGNSKCDMVLFQLDVEEARENRYHDMTIPTGPMAVEECLKEGELASLWMLM